MESLTASLTLYHRKMIDLLGYSNNVSNKYDIISCRKSWEQIRCQKKVIIPRANPIPKKKKFNNSIIRNIIDDIDIPGGGRSHTI